MYFILSAGNGCFKCGAPDHFAKDCTGQEPTKYILKDADGQHGDNNSKSVNQLHVMLDLVLSFSL